MPNAPFYSSAAWRKVRARAIRAGDGRCEYCRADVTAPGASRVDHRIPRERAPELALKVSNLRVLCARCDNRRHAEKGQGNGSLRATGADGWPLSSAHHWNRG